MFGSYSDRELKSIYPIVDKIEAMADEYKAMSDAELQGQKRRSSKTRLQSGENARRHPASYDCGYTVSGTVTSAVEENGFPFRVDDGGGFIENGTELRVSTAFVERRLYGMKGLRGGWTA